MANVKLSERELKLVTDADVILTKNRIIEKTYALLGELSEAYKPIITHTPYLLQFAVPSAKISKGENYEGLPWVMLDYPRCFSKEHVFAIRTFFWWGNFCSISLHLKGSFAQQYASHLTGFSNGWQLCIHPTEWEHHFRADNYRPLQPEDAALMQTLPFIKLAKKIPLHEWDLVQSFLLSGFKEIVSRLATDTVK